jgi:hypothetical protein
LTSLLAFLACVAIVLVAARAMPPERERVFPCAIALSLNWLWFQSAWLAHNPAQIIYALSGASVEPVWLWAMGDAITGFFIFTKAIDRGWGHLCFWFFVVQELFHALYLSEVAPFWFYSEVMLDATFAMQLLCLFWGARSGGIYWLRRPYGDRCMDSSRDIVPEGIRGMGAQE